MGDDVKELIRSAMDIREWLARLDTKLDQLSDVKDTAELANERAREALSLSQENSRNIADMKTNDRWKWGAIITLAASILGSFLAR